MAETNLTALEATVERYPEADGDPIGFLVGRIATNIRRLRTDHGSPTAPAVVTIDGESYALHVAANEDGGPERLAVARRRNATALDLTIHRPRMQPDSRRNVPGDPSHGPTHCWRFDLDATEGIMRESGERSYREPQVYPMRPEQDRDSRMIRNVVASALLDIFSNRGGWPSMPGNDAAIELFAQMGAHHLEPPLVEAVQLSHAGLAA